MIDVQSEFLEEYVLGLQALQLDQEPGGLHEAEASVSAAGSCYYTCSWKCGQPGTGGTGGGGASNFLENPLAGNESGHIDFDLIVF